MKGQVCLKAGWGAPRRVGVKFIYNHEMRAELVFVFRPSPPSFILLSVQQLSRGSSCRAGPGVAWCSVVRPVTEAGVCGPTRSLTCRFLLLLCLIQSGSFKCFFFFFVSIYHFAVCVCVCVCVCVRVCRVV